MPRLLVVQHCPTRATHQLSERLLAGAGDPELREFAGHAGVEVVVRTALEASAEDVLAADALVLGTPANFGYMSGALKHFFDSSFLTLGGALDEHGAGAPSNGAKLPYGLWVHGRYDTTGAVRSVQSIAGALPWRPAAPVLEVLGDVGAEQLDAAYHLGATLAALTLENR